MSKMYVVKRDGAQESVYFDKISSRINKLCDGLDKIIDPPAITHQVIRGLYSGVTTVELDNLAADTAASMTIHHPDYAILAARIAITNLHKQTKDKFSEVIKDLYERENVETGKRAPAIHEDTYKIVQENAEILDSAIDYKRDLDYNYFGFKTLERSYLQRINNKVVERPQQMLMRVAVGIHGKDIDAAIETYNLLSERYFTHASPTLFNAGTPRPQLSSCFLLDMQEDSINGIFKTLSQCASISKFAGGIGLSVHKIRAEGSLIVGTNGHSNGLVPMLRVFNNAARYVDQGGNKRPGAIAIYLEPWHADIFEFIDLKKNTGSEEARARDLFYALWVPDLFMKRVESDEDWCLMCPNQCPGLYESWGEKFEEVYTDYESKGKYKKRIKARKLWFHIIDAQFETGNPFMLYKDACNRKSNQQNLGTIKSSNLCTEIVQYTSHDEIAVCNLASIALNRFVRINEETKERTYDFLKLRQVTEVVTKNLNKVIDINYYPVQEARNSNMRHRPIGIGVQGLADAFLLMRYPFDSEEAKQLNREIFENIYYAACKASCDLAEKDKYYESYEGSPASRGLLQFDLWAREGRFDLNQLTLKEEWSELKKRIAKFGMRNSLLMAPMPTASTAQILGNNESIEAYTSNMYCRRVLSGEFQVVNPHLFRDLLERGLWSEDMRMEIMANYGSIQDIHDIPDDIKRLYRTVWEIPQKEIINLAADRAVFIDQSQSLNIHLAKPSRSSISSMHFYGWKKGLKTGCYYLRTRPAANPIQFTVDKSRLKNRLTAKDEKIGTGDESINGGSIINGSINGGSVDDGSVNGDSVNGDSVMACSLANGPNCDMCSG